MLVTLIAGAVFGIILFTWAQKTEWEEQERALNYRSPLQPTVMRTGYCANCTRDSQLNIHGGCLVCGSVHVIPHARPDWESLVWEKKHRDLELVDLEFAVRAAERM